MCQFELWTQRSKTSLSLPFALVYCFDFGFRSGFGVISSQSVEDGFRNVDRRFFVPQVRQGWSQSLSLNFEYIGVFPHESRRSFLLTYFVRFFLLVSPHRIAKRSHIRINLSKRGIFTFPLPTYTEVFWKRWNCIQTLPLAFWMLGLEQVTFRVLRQLFWVTALATTVRSLKHFSMLSSHYVDFKLLFVLLWSCAL